MTDIPVLIIDKLEIWKREFLFDKGREFIKYWLCPLTYKDNELIDIPSHTTSGNLSQNVVHITNPPHRTRRWGGLVIIAMIWKATAYLAIAKKHAPMATSA